MTVYTCYRSTSPKIILHGLLYLRINAISSHFYLQMRLLSIQLPLRFQTSLSSQIYQTECKCDIYNLITQENGPTGKTEWSKEHDYTCKIKYCSVTPEWSVKSYALLFIKKYKQLHTLTFTQKKKLENRRQICYMLKEKYVYYSLKQFKLDLL